LDLWNDIYYFFQNKLKKKRLKMSLLTYQINMEDLTHGNNCIQGIKNDIIFYIKNSAFNEKPNNKRKFQKQSNISVLNFVDSVNHKPHALRWKHR